MNLDTDSLAGGISRRASRLWRAGFVSCAALLLGACGSSPPVRYFTLQPAAAERTARTLTAEEAAARSVRLVSLTVPHSVDRPQLVLRTGDNTVSVNDHARWAEPLKSSLAGALTSEMQRALGGATVLRNNHGLEETAWKLGVDIQRFDAQAGKSVALEAAWSLRSASSGKTASHISRIDEPVTGDDLEMIVAAESRAVARLAREIARELEHRARAEE